MQPSIFFSARFKDELAHYDRDKEIKVIEHMRNEHSPPDRRKPSLLKMASYAGVAAGAKAFVCVLALLPHPDPLVNRFIKPRITEAFAGAYPAYSIHIAGVLVPILWFALRSGARECCWIMSEEEMVMYD